MLASAFGARVMVSINYVNSIVDPRELRQWDFRSMLLGFLGLPVPNSKRIRNDERTRRRVKAWADS